VAKNLIRIGEKTGEVFEKSLCRDFVQDLVAADTTLFMAKGLQLQRFNVLFAASRLDLIIFGDINLSVMAPMGCGTTEKIDAL
jgi:hypothetical protein